MTTNLKAILSVAGVAALMASPAVAKAERHHEASAGFPSNAHGSAAPASPHAFVTPYAPDLAQQPHEVHGAAPDFQLGGNK
jgi:hypothetical protein